MVKIDRSAIPFNSRVSSERWSRCTARRWLGRIKDRQFELWVAVLLLAVIDVGLTYFGLRSGFVELNPIARRWLAVWGPWALIAGKASAIGVGAISAWTLDRNQYLVPMVFVVIWGIVVSLNAHLLLMEAV